MKRPSRDLVDAFFIWYRSDPHSANEDRYVSQMTEVSLSRLGREAFIEFIYRFAYDGGHIQSGGHRTASRFRKTIETKYDEFRAFILKPFANDFDEIEWLQHIGDYPHFGIGLATIYLNRLDKKRFAILNNKAVEASKLLGVVVQSALGRRYLAVRDAWRQLIEWYPDFENFYRTDALSQFLIGEEAGKSWVEKLAEPVIPESNRYWIYAPGERARHWPEYSRDGLMGIGWDTIKEDLSGCRTGKELRAKYEECYGDRATDMDFGQLRDFVLKASEGDGVFVKRGTRELVGYGEVSSEYFYDETRTEYRHFRRAKWLKIGEWQISKEMKALPVKTLTELQDEERIREYLNLLGHEDLPTRGDIERAIRFIHSKTGLKEISKAKVFEIIEKNLTKKGFILKLDWRRSVEKKLKDWFG